MCELEDVKKDAMTRCVCLVHPLGRVFLCSSARMNGLMDRCGLCCGALLNRDSGIGPGTIYKMSLIAVDKVTHAYAAIEILRHVSLRVGESDRIGLVGPNGAGKSTLLRIIAGLMEPLSGNIHHSAGLRIGYLPQDPPALSGSTIYDAMLDAFSELREMESELEELAARMADDEEAMERYGRMQHEFEDRGGYEYTSRIEQVLTGLGFDKDMWARPLSKLSGGQRTRAYLAKLLLASPQ
jgi:ATP-binding cassette subfamily F protein 3